DDIGFSNYGENSHHVVVGGGTDTTTVIDGFTVASGNADMEVPINSYGGGMQVYTGNPTIRRCRFRANLAFRGGGIYLGESAATIVACSFVENIANGSSYPSIAGGIECSNSSPRIVNCGFFSNSGATQGGAIDMGGVGTRIL